MPIWCWFHTPTPTGAELGCWSVLLRSFETFCAARVDIEYSGLQVLGLLGRIHPVSPSRPSPKEEAVTPKRCRPSALERHLDRSLAGAWHASGGSTGTPIHRVIGSCRRPVDEVADEDVWLLQMPPEEEIVVMQGVLDGLKDQTIARRLGISLITVRRRVGRFIQHVGAKNRIQAVVVGVDEGWLRLELET